MEKSERQLIIRNLIESRPISSQEELKMHLANAGYNVAQATLSRDIKEMGVAKTAAGYQLTDGARRVVAQSINVAPAPMPRGSVSGLEFGTGLAVMHTAPGHAGMVASVIDAATLAPIIGTIAGDDTILIILRPGFSNDDVVKALSPLAQD
jgi:transcriptional regulator of arginine metabolism